MRACASASPGRGRLAAAGSGVAFLVALMAAGAADQGRDVLTFAGAPRVLTRAEGQPTTSGAPEATTPLALSVSPDGKTLAIAGEGPVVELREIASNRVRARLTGHTEPVLCVAFSPDGSTIATGGFDRATRLWDAATGAEKTALPPLAGWVFAVAFAADGQTLASAGQAGEVRLNDVATGRALGSLIGHVGPVRALAFSPDGQRLASAGADRVILLWDVSSRSRVGSLSEHRGAVRALAFMAAGKTLASASEDHTVKLWDVAKGKVSKTLPGSAEQVLALAVSPRGTGLAVGSYDGAVRLFRVEDGTVATTFPAHTEGVTALAFDPSTGSLITSGYDQAVKLWATNPAIGVLKKSLAIPDRPIVAAVLSPEGKTLITCGAEPFARVWETETWKERGKLDGFQASVMSATFSADSRVVVTLGANQRLRIWDSRRLTLIGLLEDVPAKERSAGTSGQYPVFALAPDGLTLACVGFQGGLDLFDVPPPARQNSIAPAALNTTKTVDPLKRRRSLREKNQENVRWLSFAPDSKSLAVANFNPPDQKHRIEILDTASGGQKASLTLKTFLVSPLVFAPDGKTLAFALLIETRNEQPNMNKAALTLWSTASWQEVGRIDVPAGSVGAFLFSPDSSRIAMGDATGSVQFWDCATHKAVGVLKAHESAVSSLSFGPGGRSLVTSHRVGTMTVATPSAGATPAVPADDPVKIWDLTREPGPPQVKTGP